MFASALCSIKAYAQDNFIAEGLFPSVRSEKMFEIGEIKLIGNNSFETDELAQFISTKPTARSIPHKILQAYYNEAKKNNAAPRVLVKEFNKAINSLEHELKFFDETAVDNDANTLWEYYNTNGFHFVSIRWTFVPDSAQKRNLLTFYITENQRFNLHSLNYIGLNKLDSNLVETIHLLSKDISGKYFNESQIISQVSLIHETLLNNGYYYSYYSKPIVSIDTADCTDSVTVLFTLGERVKIGNIKFIDSTKGQPVVTNEMKRRQLVFASGEWYSRKKVNTSIDNLLSIGTFESVIIDSSSVAGKHSDSLLNFSVISQYRKQREWEFGILGNHTQLTNYNAGLEGSVFHRNIFGMAQSVSLFANATLKDISRIIDNPKNTEYELSVGIRFAQPLLWSLDYTRIGLSTNLIYAYRTVNNFIQLSTFSFPIKFPLRLPSNTYFNNITLEFDFEREKPIDFQKTINNAIAKAQNEEDLNKIQEAWNLYSNLDIFLREKQYRLLTSNTMGLSLVGDKRNHPFNPTKGSYTSINLDSWNVFMAQPVIAGVARYFRFNFAHYQYIPITPTTSAALKFHAGSIFLFDTANSYVPLERQFFAGGANSVRGWSSRMLRYSHNKSVTSGSSDADYYLRNFVGNSSIIELSAELRFRLRRPKWANAVIAEQIANLGVAVFADAGNAFDWFAEMEHYHKNNLSDYFTKLAVAGGFGLRYDTPVGPIRLDFAWPIHDPLDEKPPFSNLVLHFGIGHSF